MTNSEEIGMLKHMQEKLLIQRYEFINKET